MPWSLDHFPVAMKNLEPEVRNKAIEIAIALLRDGHDEGFAIRMSISRATEWGRLHGPLSSFRENNRSH